MKRLAIAALSVIALAMTVGAQTANQQPRKPLSVEQSAIQLNGSPVRDIKTGDVLIVGPTGALSLAPDAPNPEWVPDPSAGHYDCPDGWTAMASVEPMKYYDRFQLTSNPLGMLPPVYVSPTLDKKGHELKYRPAPPICIKDKP